MNIDLYQAIQAYLSNGTISEDFEVKGMEENFTLGENGLLYDKQKRRIVRDYEVSWVCYMLHKDPTAGYLDYNTTYQKAKTRFFWPKMRENIQQYIKDCWECNLRRPKRSTSQLHPISSNDMFERWGIDVVGPLLATEHGNKYIVVAVDYFSRWPETRSLKSANAANIADFIYEEIICRHGAPKVIQSDRGTHFVNEIIKLLTERFKVKHALLSPYYPQSNGLVERFNRSLCEGIAKLGNTVHDWDKFVSPILFAYRTKILRISGCSL